MIMKRKISLILVLIIAFALASTLMAADQSGKGKAQATCPVMSGPVSKKVYADYEGKRVYFCCEECKQVFLKNPADYIKKLEEQGIAIEKTSTSQ
jgi:YHS domain-containing protein